MILKPLFLKPPVATGKYTGKGAPGVTYIMKREIDIAFAHGP